MSDDLRTLVRRCLVGEQAAMTDLVGRFRSRVYGLCLRMLGQREDAEDAAQETFVRVLRHLNRWDPAREFEPWLLAIAGNRCRTALATRVRRPSVAMLPGAVTDDSAAQRQAAAQLREEVSQAVHQLRPEYQLAFELFHERELSYQEIAEQMGRPIGTVKTWVHRARRQIVETLQRREVA